MLILLYDTESKSRNVLASPLGEEGHEVAKGWTVVRMIMILDVDVTAERRHYNTHRPLKGKRLTTFCASLRSGGRRLAVRKMIECHISAQPRTPFCHYVAFPLKGKREIWREKQGVIYFMYHSGVSPFGGWRHHLARWEACHMTQKVNPVTLTLYSSPVRAIPQPSARRAVKLKNPPAVRPVNPKNLSLHNPSTQPAAEPRPLFIAAKPPPQPSA